MKTCTKTRQWDLPGEFGWWIWKTADGVLVFPSIPMFSASTSQCACTVSESSPQLSAVLMYSICRLLHWINQAWTEPLVCPPPPLFPCFFFSGLKCEKKKAGEKQAVKERSLNMWPMLVPEERVCNEGFRPRISNSQRIHRVTATDRPIWAFSISDAEL